MNTKSLGEIFQEQRESLKLEPQDIAKRLNVSSKYIEIVEAEDWQALDKHFYTIGLISSYARILKIDSKILNSKIKELPFESNIKNTKHKLVNIGEHIDLTPDKKMFTNFASAAILLSFVLLIIYNIAESRQGDINSNFIIEKIKK